MKVYEFVKRHELEDLVGEVLKEYGSDEALAFMFFMLDDKLQIKEEYRDFYNMLKNLTPNRNISGRIIIDPFLGGIAGTKNSRNKRLEFLIWEEVLALDVEMNKDADPFELLHFIDHLMYIMTMHGKAFDLEAKKRIEHEEKIKESLIPRLNAPKEKFLYFLRDILSVFESFFGAFFLSMTAFLFLLYMAKYSKVFAYIWAALVDTNISTIPLKLALGMSVAVLWYLLSSAYEKLDTYLYKTFKAKLRENIQKYLERHPEASSFLNTECFESFELVITLK
ncbi:MAG: hypothetical protein IMW83_04355 [Caldanaerobacter subterraneus]|nr:hypothetical protein [Caldanaerobacter subterraneus]